MAGAQLLGLQHPVHLGGQALLQQLAAVAINQMQLGRPQLLGRLDHVADHGPPRHRMQHLGQGRTHAGPFARRQYHHL